MEADHSAANTVDKSKTVSNTDGLPLIGADRSPEIYVDGYQGALVSPGLIRFNFYSLLQSGPNNDDLVKLVNLRLMMSVQTLIQVHQAFGSMLAELERDGVIKRRELSDDAPKG